MQVSDSQNDVPTVVLHVPRSPYGRLQAQSQQYRGGQIKKGPIITKKRLLQPDSECGPFPQRRTQTIISEHGRSSPDPGGLACSSPHCMLAGWCTSHAGIQAVSSAASPRPNCYLHDIDDALIDMELSSSSNHFISAIRPISLSWFKLYSCRLFL